MKTEELKSSVRVYNCLKRNGFDTVEQIQNASDEDLLCLRGFGMGCLQELREACSADPTKNTEKRCRTISVAAELVQAIRILNEQYEKAKTDSHIHSPVAWALYHTWKQMDEKEGKHGTDQGKQKSGIRCDLR